MAITGVVIHPDELSVRWIDRAADQGVGVIGIHPVGGRGALSSLCGLLERMKTDEFRSLVDYAAKRGIRTEYEMHASSYLLDRSLFRDHPEYFRADENGIRNSDFNLCVSNADGMEEAAHRAADLASSLYRSDGNFYFWMDDVHGKRCLCPLCRDISASDQQLMFMNKMLGGIRKSIPDAKLAYLAYQDCRKLPERETPLPGIFLEYAPIEKYREGNIPGESDEEYGILCSLLDFFGKKDSKVLEYRLDNSMFSDWKKPPRKFVCDCRSMLSDMQRYKEAGIENISSFACFLGADYEKLWGEPDISPFFDSCRKTF